MGCVIESTRPVVSSCHGAKWTKQNKSTKSIRTANQLIDNYNGRSDLKLQLRQMTVFYLEIYAYSTFKYNQQQGVVAVLRNQNTEIVNVLSWRSRKSERRTWRRPGRCIEQELSCPIERYQWWKGNQNNDKDRSERDFAAGRRSWAESWDAVLTRSTFMSIHSVEHQHAKAATIRWFVNLILSVVVEF